MHGVVLAAGGSRRLGRPKQLVVVDGQTLLARAIGHLRRAEVASIRVVLGRPDAVIDAEVTASGATLVRSEAPEEGMAASLRAAIASIVEAAGEAPYGVLLTVVDQMAVTAPHLGRLVRAFHDGGERRVIASRYAGVVGVPVIWPSRRLEALASLRGDVGARAALRHEGAVSSVDLPGGERDLDVPADLEEVS